MHLSSTPPQEEYRFGNCVLRSDTRELLRDGQQEMERSRNTSLLSISALPSMLKTWMAPLAFQWQEQYDPELTLHLKGSHAEPDLEAEQIDFRITYGQAAARPRSFTELYTDRVVPACSPALLQGQAALRHPRDLLSYPLLSSDWQPRFTSPPSWRDSRRLGQEEQPNSARRPG